MGLTGTHTIGLGRRQLSQSGSRIGVRRPWEPAGGVAHAKAIEGQSRFMPQLQLLSARVAVMPFNDLVGRLTPGVTSK